jgi:polysaccharide biosynthesis transport protein
MMENPMLRFDFAYLYRLLISKWWLIGLVALLALAGAIVYLIVTPKIYESWAVVEVQQAAQKVVTIQDINQEDYKQADAVKTVEQSLLSETLLVRVVKANGLDKDPTFAPPKKDGSPYADSELAALFKSRVSVALRRGTRLIDVVVGDTDPDRAQQVAQSMIKEYEHLNFEGQSGDSKIATDSLILEANRLKEKLHKSEQEVQQYREDHHAVSLEDKQNIIVEQLKELNQKVTDAKSDRLKLESDYETIQRLKTKNPEDLLLLSSVASLPAVMDLRKQIADKESDFDAVKEHFGELHPKYIEAQGQLKQLKQALNRTLLNAGDLVMKSYEAAKVTEDKLVATLKEQEDAALELNRMAIPYDVLVREYESDQAMYDSVLHRMKETNVTQNVEENNIRVIQTPLASTKPARPRKALIIGLALLGSLVLGSGMVILMDLADGTIRTVHQVEENLGLPVLTLIPRSKRRHLDREPVVIADPASREAEAIRSLRTALSFLGERKDFKTILFTSAIPGEGKTYCSLNCAAALAQVGLRTLLIDADLRRQHLTKIFLPESHGRGLTNCLHGSASIMDCCVRTETENLFILGAGERAPKPTELLASSDLAALLAEARLHFDRVVLDSAPVNAVSDTQLIAREIDSVCLVARAGKTQRRAAARACSLLVQATHGPDAVVLNRVTRRSRDDYYLTRDAQIYGRADAYRRRSAVS